MEGKWTYEMLFSLPQLQLATWADPAADKAPAKCPGYFEAVLWTLTPEFAASVWTAKKKGPPS